MSYDFQIANEISNLRTTHERIFDRAKRDSSVFIRRATSLGVPRRGRDGSERN